MLLPNFGLATGPIYPVERTARLMYSEKVTFQVRMNMYLDESHTNILNTPFIAVGEDIYAKIQLVDETIHEKFPTDSLVTIIEECFVT